MYLLSIRYIANGYLDLAQGLRRDWLENDFGQEDVIIGARRDGELVGAVVLRLELPSVMASTKKKHNRSASLRGGKGIIRAWTTGLKHRGHGIGRDLLFEAVRITKERCGKDAQVGFAKEHANSVMVLPDMFNGRFKRDELRAAKTLDAVISERELLRKKR